MLPYLKPIISPWSKFHHAGLLIKRKIFNINFARRFVNGWRFPFHHSGISEGSLGGQSHFKITIGTEKEACRRRGSWQLIRNQLVVQNYVWSPNIVWRYMEHVYIAIVCWVPLEFVVVPGLKSRYLVNW